MSGPWEDYSSAPSGPWEDYAAPSEQQKPQLAPANKFVREAMAALPGGYFTPDLAKGLADSVLGLGQLAAHASGSERAATAADAAIAGINDWYRKNFQPEAVPYSSVAQGLGGMIVPGAALSKIPVAKTILTRALQAVPMGVAASAAQPIEGGDYATEKAKQAGYAALSAPAASAGLDVLGRALAPKVSSYVQELTQKGIYPTVGQTLGGSWKAAEEKLTSVPVLGDMIRKAQRRGLEQFNQGVYGTALEPLNPLQGAVTAGKQLPVGSEGVRKLGDTLSGAYEAALAQSVPNVVTPAFRGNLDNITSMLEPSVRDDFAHVIQREIYDRITEGGTLTPSIAKQIESRLGQKIQDYKGARGAEASLVGAYHQAQQEVRDLVAANNPDIAPVIQAINKGWTTLAQTERAAAASGAKERIFTPAQFSAAIKAGDKSPRDRAFARGTMPNQPFAQAAEEVLSSRYPDSGSIGRALMSGATLGGLGGAGWLLHPGIPLGVGAAMLPYTASGQRLMGLLMTQRPELARRLGARLSESAPYLGAAAVPGLLGAFSP